MKLERGTNGCRTRGNDSSKRIGRLTRDVYRDRLFSQTRKRERKYSPSLNASTASAATENVKNDIRILKVKVASLRE